MILYEDKDDLGFRDYMIYTLHYFYPGFNYECFRSLIYKNTLFNRTDNYFTIEQLSKKYNICFHYFKKILIELDYVTLEHTSSNGDELFLVTDLAYNFTFLPIFPVKFNEILWDEHIIEILLEYQD